VENPKKSWSSYFNTLTRCVVFAFVCALIYSYSVQDQLESDYGGNVPSRFEADEYLQMLQQEEQEWKQQLHSLGCTFDSENS
jgi:hypothetical protein